jgi:transposase
MNTNTLGIDVSKATLHLALLKGSGRAQKKQVTNDASGFAQMTAWLRGQAVESVSACLEATSTYGQAVARYLHEQGHRVSVVNPARISGFAQSELRRTKTDSADSATIARFCQAMEPKAWIPPTPETAELQQMTRRLEDLQQIRGQEKTRLETTIESLHEDIKAHIGFIEKQIEQLKQVIAAHTKQYEALNSALTLMTSIKGISTLSGSQILAEIGDWTVFGSARQLAAYAGLTPQAKESGTSVQGRTRLCKIGNEHLRRALYFPALTIIRCCEELQPWIEGLRSRGKNKMQVVGAVMHKLIRVVYGVLKSGQPYQPELLASTP